MRSGLPVAREVPMMKYTPGMFVLVALEAGFPMICVPLSIPSLIPSKTEYAVGRGMSSDRKSAPKASFQGGLVRKR